MQRSGFDFQGIVIDINIEVLFADIRVGVAHRTRVCIGAHVFAAARDRHLKESLFLDGAGDIPSVFIGFCRCHPVIAADPRNCLPELAVILHFAIGKQIQVDTQGINRHGIVFVGDLIIFFPAARESAGVREFMLTHGDSAGALKLHRVRTHKCKFSKVVERIPIVVVHLLRAEAGDRIAVIEGRRCAAGVMQEVCEGGRITAVHVDRHSERVHGERAQIFLDRVVARISGTPVDGIRVVRRACIGNRACRLYSGGVAADQTGDSRFFAGQGLCVIGLVGTAGGNGHLRGVNGHGGAGIGNCVITLAAGREVV